MNKKWLCVSLAAVLLLTAFIFFNAGKTSASSHEDTFAVEDMLLNDMQGIAGKELHYAVRKAAHLFEYALLGLAIAWVLAELKKKWGRGIYGYGFLYLLAIGVLDEYIQSFFDRTSLLSDVLIDFVGGILGFSLFAGVSALIAYGKSKRKES